MQRLYGKTLLNITFWLIAEVILSIVGLDTIADYSEFIFGHKNTAIVGDHDKPALTMFIEQSDFISLV